MLFFFLNTGNLGWFWHFCGDVGGCGVGDGGVGGDGGNDSSGIGGDGGSGEW